MYCPVSLLNGNYRWRVFNLLFGHPPPEDLGDLLQSWAVRHGHIRTIADKHNERTVQQTWW